ncbi:MAG: 50S ribosomal protein L7/L12 [Lachnospiraceae bacterium]|nr:50S ribosomal protein L7/L12 [Lachnospiraceae bacterium]
MAKLTTAEFIAALKELTVLELNELVQACEAEFGVSAAAGMVVAAAGPVEEVEEKTEFDVELTEVGEKRMDVLKALRTLTGAGLKEVKDMLDKAPSVIKAGISKQEAENVKAELEKAGAKVTLK